GVGGNEFHKPMTLGTKSPRSLISFPRSFRLPPFFSNSANSPSHGSMASYPALAAICTFSRKEAGRMVAVSKHIGQGLWPFWYRFLGGWLCREVWLAKTGTAPAAIPAIAPRPINFLLFIIKFLFEPQNT